MMQKHSLHIVGLLALYADVSLAYWRMACSVSQTSRADPILYPGGVAGHSHKFAGGSNVDQYSNFDTLFASPCSSCEVQDDKSAYWTPMLYFAHSNGSFEEVANDGMTVYYVGRGGTPSNTAAFPPGFQMISGDTTARSYNAKGLTYLDTRPKADSVSFRCINEANDIPETHYLDRTDCVHGLRAQLNFQSCWDGVNLYLQDSAHVAYLSGIDYGVCPPSHPIPIPGLFFEVLYWTTRIDQTGGGRFVFSNGDTTGYGFHGDFINGWEMDVQQAAIENCLYVDHGGVVARCDDLAKSYDINFPRTCPERPSIFDEQVKGMLHDALPGCNPITSGPESAPQEICGLNRHSLDSSNPSDSAETITTSRISSTMGSTIAISDSSTSSLSSSSTITTRLSSSDAAPPILPTSLSESNQDLISTSASDTTIWTASTGTSVMPSSTLSTTSSSSWTESSSSISLTSSLDGGVFVPKSTTLASLISSSGQMYPTSSTTFSNKNNVETVTITLTEMLTVYITVFPTVQQTTTLPTTPAVSPAVMAAKSAAVSPATTIIIPESTLIQPKSTTTVPSSVFVINTSGIENTVTRPESTIIYSERTIIIPASTITITETAAISTVILPGSTYTQPATTVTLVAPTTTVTSILPGITVTIPGSTAAFISLSSTSSTQPLITATTLSSQLTVGHNKTLAVQNTTITDSETLVISPGIFLPTNTSTIASTETGILTNTSTVSEEMPTTTTTVLTSTIFVTITPTRTTTSTTTLGLGAEHAVAPNDNSTATTTSTADGGTTVTTFVDSTEPVRNGTTVTISTTLVLTSSPTDAQSTTKFTIKGREILQTSDGSLEVDVARPSRRSKLRWWLPRN